MQKSLPAAKTGRLDARAFLRNNYRLMLIILDIPRDMWLHMNHGPTVSHSQWGERIARRSSGSSEGRQQGNRSAMPCYYHASHRLSQGTGDEGARSVGERNKEDHQGLQCLWRRRSCCEETDRTQTSYYRRKERRDYRRVRRTGTRPEDVLDSLCLPWSHHGQVLR